MGHQNPVKNTIKEKNSNFVIFFLQSHNIIEPQHITLYLSLSNATTLPTWHTYKTLVISRAQSCLPRFSCFLPYKNRKFQLFSLCRRKDNSLYFKIHDVNGSKCWDNHFSYELFESMCTALGKSLLKINWLKRSYN